MDYIVNFIIVFGLGLLDLFIAVPAGFALRLDPLLIVVASTSGSLSGAFAIVFFGKQLREWVLRIRGKKDGDSRQGRAYNLWIRYGVKGLGLIAPLLLGAPLGATLGLALGAPANNLLIWLALGILLWSAVLTLSITYGLTGIAWLFNLH